MISRDELYRLASLYDGLPILGALPGSPADVLGIRYGDILLEVNGERIRSLEAYVEVAGSFGDVIIVRLVREGEELEFRVDTSERRPTSILQAAAYLAGPDGLGHGNGEA